MESVNILEAWQQWGSGEQVTDLRLGWWSILWWGRIGKILALIGLVALAAEIIGPYRLQTLGRSVRLQLELAQYPIRVLYWLFLQINPKSDQGETKEQQAAQTAYEKAQTVTALFGYALMGGSSYLLYKWWADWGLWEGQLWRDVLLVVPVAVLSFFGAFGIAAYAALAIAMAASLTGLATVIVANLLGRGLNRPNILGWIKVGTGFVILVGFHFDLLAS